MKDTQGYSIDKYKDLAGGGLYCSRFIGTLDRIGIMNIRRDATKYNINVRTIREFANKYSARRVLLVGSNPSQASPDCRAFHAKTKSRQTVDSWFAKDGWSLAYENLVNFKIEGNKPLTVKHIKDNMEEIQRVMNIYKEKIYKIVACGKTASKGLTMAGVEHFEMPHPSGLCRFWNDKEASEAKIREMKEWASK